MWYCILFASAVLGLVQATDVTPVANCNSCCYPVKTISVSLKDLMKCSPFYTLETSSSTVCGVATSSVDSVCFSFYSDDGNDVRDDCSVYTQAVVTQCNGSVVSSPAVHSTIGRGQFLLNGTRVSYQVSFLGRVCSNVYVIYLCSLNQSSDTFVIIVSDRRRVEQKCLRKAEEVALKTFPNLQFTTLPNTVSYPCLCDSQSLINDP